MYLYAAKSSFEKYRTGTQAQAVMLADIPYVLDGIHAHAHDCHNI